MPSTTCGRQPDVRNLAMVERIEAAPSTDVVRFVVVGD
jgi:hypothetical protein